MEDQEIQDSTSKFAIIGVLFRVVTAFIVRLFTSSSYRAQGKAAATYYQDCMYASMRELLGGLSTQHIQLLAPRTDRVYLRVCRMNKATANSVDLSEGAQGHWIGSSDAKNVMLFSHGGGFYGSASIGHMLYLFFLQSEMRKRGHDFSIFVLTYTLSPGGVFPLQLRQAALALNFLLVHQSRDPSTVLVGGDSAGGNLTSALLQHIAHPHPKVPAITLTKPLQAALLISPWVCFDTTIPSFTTNAESDYLTRRAIRRAAKAYVAPGEVQPADRYYAEPATSPTEWWSEIAQRVVGKVMIWAGEREVLVDGIQAFADKVGSGFGVTTDTTGKAYEEVAAEKRKEQQPDERFTYFLAAGCAHEEIIIDRVPLGFVKGEKNRVIEDWLSNNLTG